MQNPKPIGIIYWGTKGGGNRFTFNLCMEMQNLKLPFIVSLSNSNENLSSFQKYFPNQIQLTKVETKLPDLVSTYLTKNKKNRKVIENFKAQGVENILITMPHFLDLNVYKIAKKNSMFVTRVIHDHKRHPGDIWPNIISIMHRRFASHQLVFLSKYVQLKCRYPQRRSIVTQFPEEYLSTPRLDASLHTQSCDVLIVGRIRKYKGLHILTDLVRSLNESKKVDFLLAGSGKIDNLQLENLQIVQRWLTESEFETIFLKAKIILLLHKEASQSGIPSVATANGKWIVAPKLGGIAEQIQDGINGYLYEVNNMNSMQEAILRALRKEELGEMPTSKKSESISMSLRKFLEQGVKLH